MRGIERCLTFEYNRINFNFEDEVSVWVVVFVVPINAAVNPILYTFTTPKFRRLLAQVFGRSCPGSKAACSSPNDPSARRLMMRRGSLPIPLPIERQLSAPGAIEMSQIISIQRGYR